MVTSASQHKPNWHSINWNKANRIVRNLQSRIVKAIKGKCPNCKQEITLETEWETHHIVQRSQGGKDIASNLMMLHPNCHRQLHYRDKKDCCVSQEAL